MRKDSRYNLRKQNLVSLPKIYKRSQLWSQRLDSKKKLQLKLLIELTRNNLLMQNFQS